MTPCLAVRKIQSYLTEGAPAMGAPSFSTTPPHHSDSVCSDPARGAAPEGSSLFRPGVEARSAEDPGEEGPGKD